MSGDPFLPYVSRVPLSFPDSDGPAAHWMDGTLLFVDVAGFTALSERLSRTGRAGAEELTDLLDGAFARLLAAAYENGGSLLSFGGDALLLFFEGPDHQRRAAHAAGVIRRKPAELGPLRTTVGTVRLKLSMGAHSGRYLFAVSGEDSRVVLLLGQDATTTVRLEQRATGGQVMMGASLAAAVPEASGPLEDGAALLLRTPRPPLTGDPRPPGEPVTPPARFLSPALRTHIAGQPTSEHRPVAVAFLQLRGTDALLAADADAALEHVDEVVVTAQRAAAEYGACLLGTDVDADGAKLILVAGAPLAAEHAEERVLRTCRAVLDLDTPLQLRAGVTSGHVFVGDVGPSYRRAFTVMGDRVNLAARLMASGEPGQLRTTPKVLAASRTTFSVLELEPLRLKGIAEPVAAFAVGDAIGQVHRYEAGDLVGRDAELARLKDALAACSHSGGRTVELVGEPGAGKTALLTRLVHDSAVPSLRAAAVPYEQETALGLVRRILRHVLGVDAEAASRDVGARLVGALPGLAPADLSLLLMAGDAVPPPGLETLPAVVEDELLVARLARAVRRALAVLVPGTAMLVVEDLQWADPMSTALLKAVADQLSEHPWLLCVSRRTESAGTAATVLGGESLRLEPLGTEAATELVEALTDDAPLSPHRVAALVARSGGNPLFLTELVRLSRDSADLPESVEGVVNARLDALPSYLRKMLRHAAVLGAQFDLDLLDEVSGFVPDREEWRLLDGLLRRGGSRGEFASEMFREVAYQSLPFKERRALHGKAVRALRARGSTDVELLALHAAQAHDDELTWTYSVEAGRRGLARGAHEQAVAALQRALIAHRKGSLGPAAETLEAQTLLGDALLRAGRPREAAVAYRRARGLSPRGTQGDPLLCLKEAEARSALGEYTGARRWLTLGLRASPSAPDLPARLLLLESLTGVLYRQGRYAEMRRRIDELLALTEGTGHRRSNAHAHDLKHLLLMKTSDPERVHHRTQAVAIYQELGDVQGLAKAYNNLGSDAYHECRWVDAVELFKRSRECEEQDANEVGAAISDSNLAEILLDQGEYDEAYRRLGRALRTFRAEDFRLGVAEVLSHRGLVETRRGNLDRAAEDLGTARDLLTSMGADSQLPDLVVREVELALTAGEQQAATLLLDRLGATGGVRDELRLSAEYLRAVVHDRDGRADDAEALLRLVVAEAGLDHVYRAAVARHALGTLLTRCGRAGEGLRATAQAQQELRSLGVVRVSDLLAGARPVEVPPAPTRVDLVEQRRRVPAV